MSHHTDIVPILRLVQERIVSLRFELASGSGLVASPELCDAVEAELHAARKHLEAARSLLQGVELNHKQVRASNE